MDVEALMCQNCERLKRMEELELENSLLKFENSLLRFENADLKRRLAFYENAHVAPSQRRFPVKKPKACGVPRFPGRPKGYAGRTRPRLKPDVVKAPEVKERCERCGAPLGEPCYVDHHVVEDISNPKPKQVVDYLEFVWECDSCGSKITARHPECPPEGVFGKNVYVQTTLLRYEDRLPIRKVKAALERQGLNVTPSTVLKNLGFNVETLNYAAIKRGALQNYDIVIVPDGTNRTIASRLGSEGLQKLKKFIEAGGTYFGYGEGGGSLTAITSLINVKAFFSGDYGGYNNGVVRITYTKNSPITAYYPSNGYAFVFFPVWFEAGEGAEILAKYAEKDLLVAGWWPYYDVTAAGQPAIVKGNYGSGTVILLGIAPTFRAHPEATFRLMANSIFLAA